MLLSKITFQCRDDLSLEEIHICLKGTQEKDKAGTGRGAGPESRVFIRVCGWSALEFPGQIGQEIRVLVSSMGVLFKGCKRRRPWKMGETAEH